MTRSMALFAALAACSVPAVAKDRPIAPSPLVTALGNCEKVADSAARLACYDKSGPALVKAANQGDIKIVDRETLRKAGRSLFGFSIPSFAFLGGSKADDQTVAKRLDSTITGFTGIGNGFYRFTIAEGGAVWESTESADIREAKPGEPVTITHGALGSYWAKIGKRLEIRVRRIR